MACKYNNTPSVKLKGDKLLQLNKPFSNFLKDFLLNIYCTF